MGAFIPSMLHLSLAVIIVAAAVIILVLNGRRGWALGLLGIGALLFTPAGWFALMVASLVTQPAKPAPPPIPPGTHLTTEQFICWPAPPPCRTSR